MSKNVSLVICFTCNAYLIDTMHRVSTVTFGDNVHLIVLMLISLATTGFTVTEVFSGKDKNDDKHTDSTEIRNNPRG